MLLRLLLIITLLAWPVVGHADHDDMTLESVWDDFGDMLAAPFNMSSEEAIATAAVAGVTGAFIFKFDEDVERLRIQHAHDLPYVVIHKMAELGAWYGKNDRNALYAAIAVTGSMGLASWIGDDAYLRRTTAIMVESYVFTMVITGATTMIIGRDRPYTESGARHFNWFGFSRTRDHRSLPSGHTASAFSLATVAAQRYPDWWVAVPSYTVATSIGFERFDRGHHWVSDVIIGGALGYAVSSFLVNRHTGDEHDQRANPAYVQITFGF